LHGKVTRGKRRSGHWLYEPESGALRPLDEGPGLWFDANAFSPDGERLLAERGADLVVLDIASGRTILLTKDGDPGTIENGRASWSPDGQWIVYVQSDLSAIPKWVVLAPGDPTYRTFREIPYERVGWQNMQTTGPIEAGIRAFVTDMIGGFAAERLSDVAKIAGAEWVPWFMRNRLSSAWRTSTGRPF
jgi:dipeptidyl aminopeptidase/acylaminoacyl peptidase